VLLACSVTLRADPPEKPPDKPGPEVRPKNPFAGKERERLGPLTLGLPPEKVGEVLGPPREPEAPARTWRRALWLLPNPEGEGAEWVKVEAELGATFDPEGVRAAWVRLDLTPQQQEALALYEGSLTDVEAGEEDIGDAPLNPVGFQKPWTTASGARLGMTLDEVLEAYGDPTSAPGLKMGAESGESTKGLQPFDNGALDLRYRVSEVEWLSFILRDIDPRPKQTMFRVTMIRLDRPRVPPKRGG
jgi:hypothetical protein